MWNWFPFPTIRVFTKKKKAKRYIKTITGKNVKFLNKMAEVHYLENSEGMGSSIMVVLFDIKKLKDTKPSRRAALVAHECSHIVDYILEWMGDEKPDGETRAYMLQCAFVAVIDQLGEKWLTRQR